MSGAYWRVHSGWWLCLLFSALERDSHERLADDRTHLCAFPRVIWSPSWEEGNLSSVCPVGDGGQSEVSVLSEERFVPSLYSLRVFSAPFLWVGWNMISVCKEPIIYTKTHTCKENWVNTWCQEHKIVWKLQICRLGLNSNYRYI